MKTVDLLAFDLGASNGRGILGRYDGERIRMQDAGFFETHFTGQGDKAWWDTDRLLTHMKACFQQAKAEGFEVKSFGIDTWGVDYGLLDGEGRLIEQPRAYRCSTDQEMHAAWEKLSRREMFEISGVAALNFNTVYQLYRRVLEDDPALQRAERLLLMPDLLGYLLSGEMASEYTIASTTGLVDVKTQGWSERILDALQIPRRLFTAIDRAGTLRGKLRPDIAAELGLKDVAYAAVGGHDTASAVAAIPGEGDFAFCSSGTWSLFGMESEQPLMSDAVFEANFSNEGTVQGGYRPLKNIMGLWLIQECRREWQQNGEAYSWDQIVALARQEQPFRHIVDPDYPAFYQPGDMPGKIRAYCVRTGQEAPEGIGAIARCVYDSLALKYRWALERMGEMRGRGFQSLNIVGGGIQNELLNQLAADCTGLHTTVGPTEGAALGNLLMQAQALGLVKDIAEARQLARASVETRHYEPRPGGIIEDAYGRLLQYMEVAQDD